MKSMISLQSRAIPQSIGCSFPSDLFVLKEFKDLLNHQAKQIGIAKKFRPRIYSHADYIMTKIYAILCQCPTHVASEGLNAYITKYYAKNHKMYPKTFSDGRRKRRFVPHQTDIDKYFRRFSEKDVHNLFGNVLLALCRKIASKYDSRQKWRFMADNTEYAYFGKTKTPYEQGSKRRHMGTKKIRLIQGHGLHCQNLTIFTDFYLLRKGHPRWISIPKSVEWLQWNDFKLNYALFDRGFYRVPLVKRLKDKDVSVIIPAVKFKAIQRNIRDYLLKSGDLVFPYLFQQKSGAKPWPTSVWTNVVIVGHDDVPAWKIRNLFWNGKLTYEDALNQLSAFFTTLKPWKNKRSWASWLTRTYKKRWNQETGFCSLNAIHNQFRYRYPIVQMAELYLRALIHNGWQFSRNQGLKERIHHQHLTLFWYRTHKIHELEELVLSTILDRINIKNKRKRRLYFQR